MKKIFISISTLVISLASAQNSNEILAGKFESQRIENSKKFDTYIAKRYGQNRNPEALKEIEKQRNSLAGFIENKPYFYEAYDMDQIMNSNSDYLQGGTISGLTGSFNGEGIKFTIFDGSSLPGTPARVFDGHVFFNNAAGRISNKEATTLIYGDHATSVAGFIGARNYPYTVTFTNGTTRNVNFKGIAPNSTIDAYAFLQTTLPGDTTPSTVFQKIIRAQPKISNHSYGSNYGWSEGTVSGASAWVWNSAFASPNTYFDAQGTYFNNDRDYDQIVYNNPSFIIVKSAGNSYGEGPSVGTSTYKKYYEDNNGNLVEFAATDTLPPNNCSQGYDCIGIGSLAKNIIVVGATDRITTNGGRYTTSADVIHSSYSSAGPRDDGGIKPDITAVGTSVASANTANSTTGTQGLTVGDGTSFSAPVVTGIIGLWTQINKQLFNNTELNAASAKTLMIHSALEAGNPGPDPHFGWGFINAKKGAELLVGKSNNTIIFNNETLTTGVANIKTVKASGSEPLKVTISWVDPEFTNFTSQWTDVHNNRTSKLVNDLDLRIIDATDNTTYLPWRLDYNNPMTALKGDNTVDNVEQVIVDAPVAGRNYKIVINNKGTLKNNAGANSPQNYSIIVTGYTEILGTKESKAGVLSSLTVAPSVTKDVINILKAPKKSTFTIYDLSGKKLRNGTISNDKEVVDLSVYTKGIYIIEVKTDKDVISKKIIKE
ncbi:MULTISPECIES: S8 family peptidase [unclassified Chryseobacterium]|uniref:S8 family peptidase n=1 Tax=unclassified Chryseobacterium TaxID=2593645 RepID=UPI00100BF500|nr:MULTISPECIES: S8 family peptidase [unclassified Chryseobacterium]RXM53620.1 secretion protein Por [Chryseobacterium sp. CH25]RXM63488.1 secretion protein Por [Chryseobacterium sp. CH1]